MHAFWETVASNSLVVAVLALGVALLGRLWKNPAALHLLWVFVLLKLVTPPLVTVPLALPTSERPTISGEGGTNGDTADQAPAGPLSQGIASAAAGRPHERGSGDLATPPTPPVATDVASAVGPRREIPWLTILLGTWGVGIVLLAFGQAYRILRFQRLLRMTETPSFDVLTMAEGIARRLGLRRPPEIAMLPVRLSPLVWSMGGKPRVLLSASLFQRLDTHGQETILAHELAHVRRKDHWVRLLELLVTTLFWWHPVVWWACRQLRDLEEQCCDGLVLSTVPHAPRVYATALLDTLDFLSESTVDAPLVATAAKSSASVARRITMLKNHAPVMPLTASRLVLLLAVAAVPMAVTFAAAAPDPAVQARVINRLVKDFPEKTDLSTPETAQAAWNRASARMDDQAVLDMSWVKWGRDDIEQMKQYRASHPKDASAYNEAQLNAEVVEVLTYREDLAAVISKLKFPEGVGRHPYSRRQFGRINGVWKNLGEDRLPSVEAAREGFAACKDDAWTQFVALREDVKSGRNTPQRTQSAARGARIAPGEPLGISVEKADLMGRIEWAMMHGGRDITARKSIEWGEVQKDDNENRTIRYKYYATIWDKDVYIMHQVFTFDAKGNILSTKNVEGYPQKKVDKPVNVGTQEGMKELVEDFFTKNFRDVTSRETIEWGDVAKAANGNSSIRYKYRATIWHKDAKIMNQVFTFDPKGKFVSVKNVEGFPKNP